MPVHFSTVYSTARGGDGEALALLWSAALPAIRRDLRSFETSGVSVDDILQDAFMKLHARIARWPSELTESAFTRRVRRVARWTALSRYDATARGIVADSVDVVTPRETGTVTRDSDLLKLRRLIEGLKPREKEVVHLVLKGLSYGEVADRLDLTREHARQLFHRAKEHLVARWHSASASDQPLEHPKPE